MTSKPYPQCAGPDLAVFTPQFVLPEGACDCHAHIFAPTGTVALAEPRLYDPAPALFKQYRHQLDVLGFQRAVIVQPSVYGTDNQVTLEAVMRAPEVFRAVVVVDAEIERQQLEAFQQRGARGARANALFSTEAALAGIQRLAERLAEVGWHLQLLVDISRFDDLYGFVCRLPVPVVFDHMGHLPASAGVNHPSFVALRRLLDEGRCWVKLSGAYRLTQQSRAPYTDAALLARALVATNPERLLWGSDWPHPHIPVPMPNDTDLLNAFGEWVTSASLRQQILVDNPAQLYGFDAP